MDQHRPILLTSPDGTNSIINNSTAPSIEDSHNTNSPLQDDPPSPKSPGPHYLDTQTHHSPSLGVQFDAEQLQRGRSRIKRRNDTVSRSRDAVDINGNPSNDSSSSSNVTTTTTTPTTSSNQPSRRGSGSGSRSFSRSRSRSRSRTASRIRDEEFLKWTVLRQDPSMRLHNYKVKYSNTNGISNGKKKKNKNNNEDEDEEEEEEDTEEEEEEEEDFDDTEDEEEDTEDEEDEEESDEEQVSDIENDNSINEQFNYDLGTKVLPNFCSSINDVLESSKPWIDKYESENANNNDSNINVSSLEGGYIRGVLTLNKRGPLNSNNNATATTTTTTTSNINTETIQNENMNDDSYILYVDLTSESIYAITYVMGTLVKNGDTVYIVHWHSDSKDDFVKKEDIVKNIIKLRNHVLHLLDCVSATVDNLDVVILSLTHPYPKHLLNEMINGLQPLALCCSLSMTLSGLQNFVCSVPTFIIRKKLKRAKKKGIFD